ncbi:MAG: DUF308 domain-containing protein [Clostridia bacterium]|nr:DUF308 domain-containing protein [Clostridia bacterium]MDY5555614.1 DUF308 domain-containing protein [Blautia sp.]
MGKKISNLLKGEIFSSIFYIAFGLCLILIPNETVNIICKVVFGMVLIAAGIYHIWIYAAEKEKATILDLFTGVISTVLGVFLFFTPQIVIKILPFLLGSFVLVDSIWKIKESCRLKKTDSGLWKAFLVGSLIFIILGISIFVYPFSSVTKMVMFCGCILTANGAADIIFLILVRIDMKKAAKGKQEPDKLQPINEEQESNESEKTDSSLQMEQETTQSEEAEQGVSPAKEIKEMTDNHQEPLEEWKD